MITPIKHINQALRYRIKTDHEERNNPVKHFKPREIEVV